MKEKDTSVKRIVHMVGKMDMGGQETLIMNLYRNIDRTKVQFDFIVNTSEKGYYDEEIQQLGGNIYGICSLTTNLIKHCQQLKKILKENQYETIHRHTCSSVVAIDLLMAKLAGVKNRIVHSHANRTMRLPILNILCKPFMNQLATQKLACSKEAAIFLFGKKQAKEVQIVKNSIPIDKFKFDESKRNEVRKKYNAEGKFIVGHVGRLDYAKNHAFMIEMFQELLKKEPNCQLWLIGSGPLENEIKEKVKQYGIEENVLLWGTRADINELIMGMDLFIFPSIYEGLGIALIEAQCSGIKCIASSNIQNEAIVTDNVEKIDTSNIQQWIQEIQKIKHEEVNSRNIEFDERIKAYEINELVKHMYEIWRIDK